MKLRKESPFFGITEEQIDLLIESADARGVDRAADDWELNTGKGVTTEQMRRFLRKAKRERMLFGRPDDEEEGDGGGELAKFAERAADGKARDGLIEAARQRLFEEALEKGDSAALLELYRAANEERAREREVEVERERVEVEKRKAAVAEENARIGWRKTELLAERVGGQKLLKAQVVSSEVVEAGGNAGNAGNAGRDGNDEGKVLPFLAAVLREEGVCAEVKLARLREVIAASGSEGQRLLEAGNLTQRREDAAGAKKGLNRS